MVNKYLHALRLSWKDLRTHPFVFLGIIGLLIAFLLATRLFMGWGMASGFLLGLLQILALSFYFNWLNLCQAPRSLKFEHLLAFNYSHFIAILNVAFILFVAEFVLTTFSNASLQPLRIGVNLMIVIGFNVLPEVINKYQDQGVYSFTLALEFMKKKWLEWIIPLILPILPTLVLEPKIALLHYATSNPLMPFSNVFQSFVTFSESLSLLFLIPIGFFAHWLMLFRRRLFDQLV